MKDNIKLKGIIFDLDGTLADTLPVCFTAFRHAFLKYLNVNFTDEEISAHFGLNEEGIIRKLVPSEWQACLQIYLHEYEKAHIICDRPFPGIETILKYCQDKNIALGIVTGKGKNSAVISLRYLGLEDYFKIVETGSADGGIKPLGIESILEKWNIAPSEVAYVGDSPSDMMDAKEVGVVPLAAAWAESASFERLEAMAPWAIFPTVNNFLDWFYVNS